jgi:hypothetical protein
MVAEGQYVGSHWSNMMFEAKPMESEVACDLVLSNLVFHNCSGEKERLPSKRTASSRY